MSWLQRLYQTYKQANTLDLPDSEKPVPAEHTIQNAHINIVLDGSGKLLRANVLEKAKIILPATELSQNRVGNEAPHALADTLQYVAKDYLKYGGDKQSFFDSYVKQLENWCSSEFAHQKVRSVLAYVKKGRVIEDLVAHGVIPLDSNQQFLRRWENKDAESPALFSVLPKNKGEIDPRTALVCWSVEISENPDSSADTWKDTAIWDSWIKYVSSSQTEKGFCFGTGKDQVVARLHPAKLRNSGDKAKLISSNDDKGLTYLGRFFDAVQSASIGSEVSQNAHSALRWLISRQGYRNEDQVTVAWALSCKNIPNPLTDIFDYLQDVDLLSESVADQESETIDHGIDLGQGIALKLKSALVGYRQQIDNSDQLSLISLDSATPGRMAITYYREFSPDAYFAALKEWQEDFSWYQRQKIERPGANNKQIKYTVWPQIAPTARNIAETAFGKTLTSELRKQIVARILPCIVEGSGRAFPFDIVQKCFARACNPAGSEKWEWEKDVGVACAVYRGYCARHPQIEKRRFFSMALDKENRSRDYLYGRLLAVAENLEGYALSITGEDRSRSTTAERYMQRFAARPFNTWRNIALALVPYKDRLRKNRPGFLIKREKEETEIMNLFNDKDFTSDNALSGEFLLGYHCQKMELLKKSDTENKGE